MSTQVLIGIIGFLLVLVLVFMRVWVGFSLIIVGFVGMWVLKSFGYAGSIIGNEPFSQSTAYAMTCMPLFTIMGTVISATGLGSKLYRFAKALVGHIRGGLGISTVCACAIFAAICGNSQVTALTMGRIAYPEMKNAGYRTTVAIGGIAAGGGIGIMIPPSLGFMIYGLLTEESIGLLFMCGLIPGIILTLIYCTVYGIIGVIHPDWMPTTAKAPLKEVLVTLKDVWAVLLLMVIMLGGIYGGVFTATEAGAVGCLGSITIAAMAKCLNRKVLYRALLDGTRTCGMVMILLVGAKVFMRFITLTNITNLLSAWILGLDVSRYIILLVVIGVYAILGSIFDTMSAILLTVPFLYPVMTSLGFDPLWFGVFVVAMMELGEISPPIGLTCFVLAEGFQLPTKTVFAGVLPFIVGMAAFIAIICCFPQITLLLV